MKTEKQIIVDIKNSRGEIITKAITGPLWTSICDLMTIMYKHFGDVDYRFHHDIEVNQDPFESIFDRYVDVMHASHVPIDCTNYYDALDQLTYLLAEHDYQSPEEETWIIIIKLMSDGTAMINYTTTTSETAAELNMHYGCSYPNSYHIAILRPYIENMLFRNFDTLEDIANLMSVTVNELQIRLEGYADLRAEDVTMDTVIEAYDEHGTFYEDLCLAFRRHCHTTLHAIFERNAREILDSVICKPKKRVKKVCQMSVGCEVLTSWIDGEGFMYRTTDSVNGRLMVNTDDLTARNPDRYYFDEWKVTDWKEGD